jgi:hypothetical protein
VKGLANHRSSWPTCRGAASACSLLTSMIRPQAVQVSRYLCRPRSGMKNSENLRLPTTWRLRSRRRIQLRCTPSPTRRSPARSRSSTGPTTPVESSVMRAVARAPPHSRCGSTGAGRQSGRLDDEVPVRASTASYICRPCPFDALHRERSARVRISGRTVSASVVTVQILCKSLTDTSPSPCPTGHTRIGEGDLLPDGLQRGWAGFVGSPWEGGLIVGEDLVGSIVRGFGGGPDRSGANASGEPELGFIPSASSACRVCSASTIGSRFPCEVS